MTDLKYDLFRDFDTTGDNGLDRVAYMRPSFHGVFRAVVERDEHPDAPYSYAGDPVFRIAHNYYGGSLIGDEPEIGRDSWHHDGIPHDMHNVWERMADLAYETGSSSTLMLVDRYLRIFHGGSAEVISSTIHQGGDDYLVYDTRAMREWRGCTGDILETSDPSAEDWQAYIDGEVYVIWVEQADDFDEDGEPISWTQVGDGLVGGFYGDDYTAQAAIEELESTIEYLAADMLPLEA